MRNDLERSYPGFFEVAKIPRFTWRHRRNLANDTGVGVQNRPWVLGTLRNHVRQMGKIRLNQSLVNNGLRQSAQRFYGAFLPFSWVTQMPLCCVSQKAGFSFYSIFTPSI
jgi:hypothetical protein